MKTIKELRGLFLESKGLASKQRLPILEEVWRGLQEIELAAVREPFSVPLVTIREVRAFAPEAEQTLSRVRGIVAKQEASS